MVDWKNIGIIVGPLATLLSSGVIVSLISNIYEQQNQPDINFLVKPEPGLLPVDKAPGYTIKNFTTEISNMGEIPATDLRISMNYPSLNNFSVDVNPETLERTGNGSTEGRVFKIDAERLAVGARISLNTMINSSRYEDLERIPCTINVSYKEGSRSYDCDPSIYTPNDPYFLSLPTFAIAAGIAISAISLIMLKMLPPKLRQRSNSKMQSRYLLGVIDEIANIYDELRANSDSTKFFSDKVWKSIPFMNRRQLIHDGNHYSAINGLFRLVKERDDVLKSLINDGSTRKQGLNYVTPKDNEVVRDYNIEISSLAKEVLNIDWNKYHSFIYNKHISYPSYLIVPMVIVFSLILTYVCEALLYGIFLHLTYEAFIYTWYSTLSSREIYENNINIWIFFILSTILRSTVAYFMFRFMISRFAPVFVKNQVSYPGPNISPKISKAKIIVWSIGIMGLPSLMLPLTLQTLEGRSFYADPNILLVITISIPLFDAIRMVLAIFAIRSVDKNRVLYFVAAVATLLSGLLYVNIGLNSLMGDGEFITGSIIIATMLVGIIQIGWSLPMAKQASHKMCYAGIVGFTISSVILLIILVNLPMIYRELQNNAASTLVRLPISSVIYIGSLILLIQIIYILATGILVADSRRIQMSKKYKKIL